MVGFEDGEHPERHEKLRRKDTPHYLKNKRIDLSTNNSQLEQIMAIVGQKQEHENGEEDEGENIEVSFLLREDSITTVHTE